MAVQQFCTFFLDDHCFGVEVEKVQEVLRHQKMTQIPLAPSTVKGLINLRGQIVVAIDLRQCLDFDEREGALSANVVLRTDDGAVSLLVDRIGDVMETTEDSFEEAPETLTGAAADLVHGVHKLEDTLMLVLDTEKTIRQAGAQGAVSNSEGTDVLAEPTSSRGE